MRNEITILSRPVGAKGLGLIVGHNHLLWIPSEDLAEMNKIIGPIEVINEFKYRDPEARGGVHVRNSLTH